MLLSGFCYTDDKEYMKDLVYKENPFLALVPKNESPDGFAGEIIYLPALNKAKSVNPNETKLTLREYRGNIRYKETYTL